MAVLLVKPGAQPYFLLHLITTLANLAAALANPAEVWITSCMDGLHSERSLHYALRAVDIRTKNFPTMQAKLDFVAALRVALGRDYDVLFENPNSANEHVHVEYDPN